MFSAWCTNESPHSTVPRGPANASTVRGHRNLLAGATDLAVPKQSGMRLAHHLRSEKPTTAATPCPARSPQTRRARKGGLHSGGRSRRPEAELQGLEVSGASGISAEDECDDRERNDSRNPEPCRSLPGGHRRSRRHRAPGAARPRVTSQPLCVRVMRASASASVARPKSRRLLLEPAEPVRVVGHRRRQDLDGHVALQPRVARAVDLAHSARPERGADLVRSEPCSGGKRHDICSPQVALERRSDLEACRRVEGPARMAD
jgi:hypothetical protein